MSTGVQHSQGRHSLPTHVILFILVRFPTSLFPRPSKSLTKSRVTTDSVRDELNAPRGKRMYAKVMSSSKDESPSKRQRMTKVNGREKDGVDGGTFPVAAKVGVSEEPGNDV